MSLYFLFCVHIFIHVSHVQGKPRHLPNVRYFSVITRRQPWQPQMDGDHVPGVFNGTLSLPYDFHFLRKSIRRMYETLI